MELALFLFAISYLVIIFVGVTVALKWSRRCKLGFFETAGMVLATLFVIFAIPFGDHTLGEIKKHQLCKEYGGTKIYRVVENVDGFMWERSGGQGKPPYTTHGYAFYEASDLDGRIFRYTKRSTGTVDNQVVESLRAQYVVRAIRDESVGQKHVIRKFMITDANEKKVLATHGSVVFDGGWLGFGSTACPNQPFDRIAFVNQVLKPGKSKE
ncbi:MAG: hypothetical protein ACO1PN_05255 [Betaproteobacteria bacterium]